MVFDLGKAMRKKEEFESARLMDFEFRQRARAMRLLAAELGMDPGVLVGRIALAPDDMIIDELATERSLDRHALARSYANWQEEARRQLIGERGDPTPYRLG